MAGCDLVGLWLFSGGLTPWLSGVTVGTEAAEAMHRVHLPWKPESCEVMAPLWMCPKGATAKNTLPSVAGTRRQAQCRFTTVASNT